MRNGDCGSLGVKGASMTREEHIETRDAVWLPGVDRPVVWLLALICFQGALWLIHPKPIEAYDIYEYSRWAHCVAEGLPCPTEAHAQVFGHRLAVVYPVALTYRLFGVDNATTHIWPLLTSLLLLASIWITSDSGRSRIFAGLVFVGCYMQFANAVLLYPDLTVAAFMAMTALGLRLRQRVARSEDFLFAHLAPMLTVAFLVVAFMAKLSAYWVVVFWVIVLAVDVRRRDRATLLRFHLPCVFWGVIMLNAYLWFVEANWGHPLARLHVVMALDGKHMWRLSGDLDQLLPRLTYRPITFLVWGFSPAFALALGRVLTPRRHDAFWIVYFVCMSFAAAYMSTSFSSYQPLPLWERMFLPVLPAVCVLAGSFLRDLFCASDRDVRRIRVAAWIVVALMIVSTAVEYRYAPTYGELKGAIHLVVAVSFALALLARGETPTMRWLRTVCLFASLFLILAVRGVVFPQIKGVGDERDCARIVKAALGKGAPVRLLCADERSAVSLDYYWGHAYPDELRVAYWTDDALETIDENESVLLYADSALSFLRSCLFDCENHEGVMRAVEDVTVLIDTKRRYLAEVNAP